jgi:hypothetical protein
MQLQQVGNTIYLKGRHEGWIINLLGNGVEIVSPGCGNLEIEQENHNTVRVSQIEKE